MYIGIGPEKGKRITDKEAFGYACERCLFGEEEEKDTFCTLAKEIVSIEEFSKELVEWFYSGNWLYDPMDNANVPYIIRFTDGSLRSFYGTYLDAVNSARTEAKERKLGFEVN